MKKVFVTAVIAGSLLFANAQSTMRDNKDMKKEPAKKETMKKGMHEHVCTAACKDGKHVYAHGEKGHVCTKECHKKM